MFSPESDRFNAPQVHRFRLYDDVWTPDNGMLTAAMKLLRRNIERKYQADIAAMYA